MSIINVQNLSKQFKSLTAVNDISFTVNEGEVFGFLGPNGAGKTTTINILCTLLSPQPEVLRSPGTTAQKMPDEVRARSALFFRIPRSMRA